MKKENKSDLRKEELLDKIANLIQQQPPEKQRELIEKYASTDRR